MGNVIDNLHVLPSAKGQGVGAALLGAAAEWSAAIYPSAGIYLWCFEQNAPACRFYEQRGGVALNRSSTKHRRRFATRVALPLARSGFGIRCSKGRLTRLNQICWGRRTAALEKRGQQSWRLGWVVRSSSGFPANLLRSGPAAFGHTQPRRLASLNGGVEWFPANRL